MCVPTARRQRQKAEARAAEGPAARWMTETETTRPEGRVAPRAPVGAAAPTPRPELRAAFGDEQFDWRAELR